MGSPRNGTVHERSKHDVVPTDEENGGDTTDMVRMECFPRLLPTNFGVMCFGEPKLSEEDVLPPVVSNCASKKQRFSISRLISHEPERNGTTMNQTKDNLGPLQSADVTKGKGIL